MFKPNTLYKVKNTEPNCVFNTIVGGIEKEIVFDEKYMRQSYAPTQCEEINLREFFKMDLEKINIGFEDGMCPDDIGFECECEDMESCEECWRKAFELRQKEIRNSMETAEKIEKINNTKADKHKVICNQLTNTYIKKNADYGDSFGETFKELGIISAITRISDKVNRLKSLVVKKERQVKDESIKDTLLDCANYCIMTVMELEEEE